MMKRTYKTIFTTERGLRHQNVALAAAPEMLSITMLREPDKDTLLSHLPEAEYLISERAGVIDAEMIKSAPNLKLIQRLGSLFYDIDLHEAKRASVAVCYLPIPPVIRVAEHLVLQMLALNKKLRITEGVALAASTKWGESKRTNEDTFAYNWSMQESISGLWQQTIGILGFGEIGVEVARRLQGWGSKLIYNKRRRLPESVEIDLGLTYVDMDTLLAQSDYIANLLPYFSSTDMLLNAKTFSKMKDGASFVSCGSGSVIDEYALADAIKSGKLFGAALDTFEWEPIKADHPLISLASKKYNVLLTPHIAAGAAVAPEIERAGNYTNIIHHINGASLEYRVA